MGNKAHVYTKKIVELSSDGYFNYSQSELNDYLYDLKNEMYSGDYDGDPFYTEDEFGGILPTWEIEKSFIIDAIEYLKGQPKEEYAFESYTNEYVIMAFESWLKDSEKEENFSYPDYVYLSWF